MRVSDAMSRELNRTGPETTIAEAASLMSQRGVGSALVCRGDRLLGIFTERDILRAVSHDASAMGDSLEHWMTRKPLTVAPDTDLDEALRIIVEGHFRHLPVQIRIPDIDELDCMSKASPATLVRQRNGQRPFGIDDAAVERYWLDIMP